MSENKSVAIVKKRNSVVKIAKYMAIGAVIGLCSSIGAGLLKKASDTTLLQNVGSFLSTNLFWIHLAAAVLLQGLAGYMIFKGKDCLSKLKADEDDTLEIELDFDEKMNFAILFNSSFIALNFILFGIELNFDNKMILASIVLFLVLALLGTWIEFKTIRMIQMKNPNNHADPTSLKFDKQWVESCDEAERLAIYKSSYSTVIVMKYVLIGMMLIALISKNEFGTGNLPIIVVGVIWMIQTVTSCIYSQKYSKMKLTR